MIYERDVIRGDFVLISGDTVTNISLSHKERRKKDNNVIMTMFIQQSELHHTKGVIMGIHSDTKQLLYHDAKAPKHYPNHALHNDVQAGLLYCYLFSSSS